MLLYFAHETGAAHVPHDGASFWLIIAVISVIVSIGLWFGFRKYSKQNQEGG